MPYTVRKLQHRLRRLVLLVCGTHFPVSDVMSEEKTIFINIVSKG